MADQRILSPMELYEQIRRFRERQQLTMERAAKALQHGSELLRRSCPDTFLGRQHYELVALPEEITRDERKSPGA